MMKTHKGPEAEPASKVTSYQPLQDTDQALPPGWESRTDETSGEHLHTHTMPYSPYGQTKHV